MSRYEESYVANELYNKLVEDDTEILIRYNVWGRRGLMQGINMEKSSQGCYKAIQIGFCDSYHNKIIDVQNRLPYSKVWKKYYVIMYT